jgi:hypothetical protein
MLGRYDPRDNHGRCRSDSYERHQGSRGGATETTSARIVDGMYSVEIQWRLECRLWAILQ